MTGVEVLLLLLLLLARFCDSRLYASIWYCKVLFNDASLFGTTDENVRNKEIQNLKIYLLYYWLIAVAGASAVEVTEFAFVASETEKMLIGFQQLA